MDAEITNGTQEVQAYVASSPSSTAGTGMMRDQVVYFNLSQAGAQSDVCRQYDHRLPPFLFHISHILSHLTGLLSQFIRSIYTKLKHALDQSTL